MKKQQHSDAARFEPHRPHLAGLAYRMLGSRVDAEDIVQEAYVRWHVTEQSRVANTRAFLSKLVVNLCLDQIKSARVRREEYVGPWLPEPVLDESSLSPEAATEYAADLSVALLLALQRLSPLERAAFLLHDVFEVAFSDVAEALGRSEASCRQLATRARSNIAAARPRFRPDEKEAQRLTFAFAAAAASGDTKALTQVLAHDVAFYSDGGGKVSAAMRPILGADRVAEFLIAVSRAHPLPANARARYTRINGQPGLLIETDQGPVQTMAFDIADGAIAAIYVVRNPDKLRAISAPAESALH